METKKTGLINKRLIYNDFEIEHRVQDTLWTSKMDFHDYYECILCISGNVNFQIEDYTVELPPSSLILLKPNQLHRPILCGLDIPYDRYILYISPAVLDSISTPKSNLADSFQFNRFRPKRLAFPEKEQLVAQFEESFRYILSPDEFGMDILIKSSLIDTLVLICRLFLKPSPEPELPVMRSKLTAYVINYIETHISKSISLDDLSTEVNVSKHHLSHVFKQETNISIYKFILQKRIIQAREFLLQGYYPNNVCFMCGFNDYSNFYRAFLNEYGISPRKYQKLFLHRHQEYACKNGQHYIEQHKNKLASL
jgi:AraC-like DNA-binding protein